MSDAVLEVATGVIDGVNVDFTTSVAYFPGTLHAYLNGLLVERDGDEGPIEIGGVDVRMRLAPQINDTLHFWYRTGPPTPGAYVSPPKAYHAINLVPDPRSATSLAPAPHSAEASSTADLVPRATSATELVPEPHSSVDLRPKPISAEEI